MKSISKATQISLMALACAAFVAGPVWAGLETNEIIGTVTDWQTRAPIAAADIVLYQVVKAGIGDVDGGEEKLAEVKSTKTDAEGNFSFKCEAGVFKVEANAKGYRKIAQDVIMVNAEGVKQSVDIQILPENVELSAKQEDALRFVAEAMADIDEGNKGKAKKKLEKAIEKDPNCAAALNALGVMAQEDQNLDQATQYFEQAIAADPVDPSCRFNLANLLIVSGKYAEAIPLLDKALEIEKDSFKGHVLRGTAHYHMNTWDKADADLRAAYQQDPKALGTGLLLLGNSNLKLQNGADSLMFYEKYLELFPEAKEKDKINEVIGKLKQALAAQKAQEEAAAAPAAAGEQAAPAATE